MHLAAALGISVCAIFGPSSSIKNRPYGNNNILLHLGHCSEENNILCDECQKEWTKNKKLPSCLDVINEQNVFQVITNFD